MFFVLLLMIDVGFSYELFMLIMKFGDDYMFVVVFGDSWFDMCIDVVDVVKSDGVVVVVFGIVSLDEVVFMFIEKD